MVERAFVDAHGRMHWPWRVAAFGFFAVAAFLVAQLVVYPVVSAVLGATGVRFVAWPWISLFAIVAAHVLVKQGVDRRVTWAQIGLGEAAVAPGRLALGHPIGASGARVLVTLLHAMADRNVKRGLATLCLGGGDAVALEVERAG